MRLDVTSINFTGRGAAIVEVSAHRTGNPPTAAAIDAVTYRVYIPPDHASDSVGDLKAIALKVIADFKPAS